MVDLLEGNYIQGLLENKAHFLKEILTCSQMMAELTYENHENEYGNLLETRERCIEALNSIEAALQSELQSSDKVAAKNDEVIVELTAQIKFLVQEIVALDERNKAALSTELQSLKMRINALKCGRKGISGYEAGQRMHVAGMYTDSRK
jgi:chromosome segregation ATPase